MPAFDGSVDERAYRAVVLDPDRDQGRIDELRALAAEGRIDLLDTIDAQLAGLAKRLPPPGEVETPVATRWAWFPWRRCAVHVLAPPHFDRLRLDRNRNKITPAEQERLRTLTIAVVGLSVGHAIAHTLALEGLCGRLRLADFDEIELSNLNRIPSSLVDLGRNKAIAAARRIAELDPYFDVGIDERGAVDDNFDALLDGVDVLVEECDSLDVKLRLRSEARRRGIPVLMETSDLGLLDVERFDLEPDRPLLHGLIGDADADSLRGLSTEDKVPYVLSILEADHLSTRFAASLVEVDRTVSTWPQLGGDVTLGAATVAAAVRRLARGGGLPSGRVRVSLDGALDRIETPSPPEAPSDPAVPRPDPRSGPTLAERLAAAAALAPSAANNQPWRLVWADPVMSVHVDRARAASLLDVGGRGALVATGAAAESMRVLAAGEGRGSAFVPVDAGDHVGDLRLDEEAVDAALAALAPHLDRRVTNRRHDPAPSPIDPAVIDALHESIAGTGARLSFLTDAADLTAYGRILGCSDRLRYLTADLHRDLLHELRFGDEPVEQQATGIGVSTLELDVADRAKLAIIRRADVMAQLREWDGGAALGEPARKAIAASSAVVAVTMPRADDNVFLRGGQALLRVWVAATAAGLAAQPVSPVWLYAREVQGYGGIFDASDTDAIDTADTEMAALFGLGDDALILVLRLSHAPPATAVSGRLPVADILEVRP